VIASFVNVCGGIRRILPSQVAADAQGVRGVEVELWAIGHRFDRGHCIRVQVASAAFPCFARNPNAGEPPATAPCLVPTNQEVFHDSFHSSHILLPTLAGP
jgi:predicted acyl esterase